MAMIYKLGDGPINYDWNSRYLTIEGTEIFYSPSQFDKDRKTINVYEGAVSNICKIKGKSFAFCVILPPPNNKSLFFAADTYDEAYEFRNKILIATLNNVEGTWDNPYLNKGNNGSVNFHRSKLGSYTNMKPKHRSGHSIPHIPHINPLYTRVKFNHPHITDEFLTKLEQLKTQIILNESKFTTKFKGDLKISIPTDHSNYDYSSFIKEFFFKFSQIILVIYLIHSIFSKFIYTEQNTLVNILIFIGEYLLFKKIKTYLNKDFINPLINKKEIMKDCNYLVKASTVFEGNREELLGVLLDPLLRIEWDIFIKEKNDIKLLNNSHNKDIKKNINLHMKTENDFTLKFSLPSNDLISSIFKKKETSKSVPIDILKYLDNKNNYYIAFRQGRENNKSSSNYALLSQIELFELFMLVPIKDIDEEKTLVIFLTNFDAAHTTGCNDLPFFHRQKLKEDRLSILTSLKEYLQVKSVKVNEEDLDLKFENKFNLMEKTDNIDKTDKRVSFNLEKNRNNYNLSVNYINSNNILLNEDPLNNSDIYMETVRSRRSLETGKEEGPYKYNSLNENNNCNDNENVFYHPHPDSVITNGERVTLEERFPGYLKNAEGGVECRNYEELKTQDGIILEVMKRAGKQLLEGKNVVAVSLPVRIFEPRSTLSRITDNWGAGPNYFNKIAESTDPVERMKLYIAFAVSGMHMNIKQLKPFNPILGETYQAKWIDGSSIYAEHMSHHPPISRFLINSNKQTWKFYGHYEYVAKLKSITGNVIGGQFKGPNILELSDGTVLTFSYPSMNITGLMYGRRIIEWEGSMEFHDEKNDLHASFTFTQAPGFFKKFKDPTDVFRGELKHGERVLHKIYGSPIDKLLFDDQIFWELETTDIIKPTEPKICLPSDCRYRTDLIALADSNIPRAEEEKLRLEVLQRADRALRQKSNKNKH